MSTERKRIKEALDKRLAALAEPPETADISFTDLFNVEEIQKIQDAFAKATNVASIITHPDGTPITRPSNFCRLCRDIIRKTEKGLANCYYSDAIIGRQNPAGPIIQPCLSGGLWDAGASITLGGKHVANWLIGQVKNEAIDEEKIIRYASEIGADQDEFRQALQEVPVMSNEQFQKVANALFLLANELSLKAYQNVQQVRFITKRKWAEQERLAHLRFFEYMDQINRAIQGANDLEQMMSDVLDVMLSIFDCDRAWLVYPCDPNAPSWQVPMERTKPEYPGANVLGLEVPMDQGIREAHTIQLASDGPVKYGPGGHPLPEEVSKQFGIKSFISIALYPKVGKPWQFGMHQCSYARQWTAQEERLFQEIGRRLADGLTSLLSYQELQQSEERLRLTLEAAQIGIWDWDILQDRWYASPTYYTMLGYAPKNDFGERGEWLERLHPDDRDMVYAKMQRVLARDFREYRYEARMRHADGAYRWVSVVGFQIQRDQDGQVTRMLGVRMDITDRKRAEEELRAHRDHLEELVRERTAELTIAKDAAEEALRLAEAANQAKSIFLAQMSHELRTPLNAVLGFSQLMTRDPNLTPRQRANLETIGRSGEHLLALINDVLELSRIEAGRAEVQAESFDLWHMLLGLEEMFRLRAETKGLTLVFERGRNVPQYVGTDANKLRQVLINLLGNAVKFTQKGGVTLRVNYGDGDRVSGRLLFEVEDSGPGIVLQEMESVFDPFVQTESGRKSRTGSGLGLPISRHFVRLMGGDIGVTSELGAGSVFRFDVPVQLVAASEVQPVQPMRRVVGLEPGQRAADSGLADGALYRLLVVEDVDSNRQLLVQLLQLLGFDVREAANGQAAIDIWQQWRPHLIWMDMRMPVMDGLEASRRIKADARGQDVIIVALTASSFEEDREMILSQGCDDYIRKPFREADILDALTRHLDVRFVYEEIKAQEREELELSELRSRISDLPPDLLANLERAATIGYTDQISDLVDQIRAHDAAVADALARLADDFEYVRIVTLIQGTGGRNE